MTLVEASTSRCCWGTKGTACSGGARDMGPGYGWLVGEAVIQDGALNGTIAFYPYALGSRMIQVRPGQPDKKPELQTGRRDWQAKRIAP